MKSIRNSIFSLILVLTVIVSSLFTCSAVESKAAPYENLQKIGSEILSVSYRGDISAYPDNSLEGVLSAFKKGADMVSVNVMKTADGVFILCENESLSNICNTECESVDKAEYEVLKKSRLYDSAGKLTDFTFATVEQLIEKTKDDMFIVLDFDWEDRDWLFEIIKSNDAVDRIFLRTKQGASDICEWVNSKVIKPYVIGVYDGGIIFNAISHINKLSSVGMPLVQYQSKNYFNVMYGSLVCDKFSKQGKATAIAPMYSDELCGLRSDSQSGWDELIEKGFTVIETNNIDGFNRYLKNRQVISKSLDELINKALTVDKTLYSYVSVDNLNSAVSSAQQVAAVSTGSLNQLQSSYSQLVSAMNNLMVKTGDDTQKGALNITAGKVFAALFVCAVVLCGEFYMHKMHVRKRKRKQ